MGKTFDIIYEDDDMLLVNKPPRFLTIPDRYAPEKPNIYNALCDRYGKVFIVHRLDKETSGILVFAKNESAHSHLSRQFEQRSVHKEYLALVDGVMHKDAGTIDAPIAEHRNKPGVMVIAKKGKPSVTDYRVAERYKLFTLVTCTIKTGRMHQIRVHLHSIGYPLAVDAVYGRRPALMLSEIKGRKFQLGKYTDEELPLIDRSILHAHALVLQHPTTDETMRFTAPPPKDFKAVLQQLDKWGR
jgi:23S rRNA pseudouridine1911/1915/1917 synthase